MTMLLEFKNVEGISEEFNLHHVNFELEAGYIMGLAGKNGAGKSTMLRYILGRDKIYEGNILLRGIDIHANKQAHIDAMQDICYASDDNEFFMSFSAVENGKMLKHLYNNWSDEVFRDMLSEMNVPAYIELHKLSRGQYFKFQIAAGCAHDAKLYLLDEVTGGMDPIFRKDFFKIMHRIIGAEEASIILVTHIQEEIDIKVDFKGIMEKGVLSYE